MGCIANFVRETPPVDVPASQPACWPLLAKYDLDEAQLGGSHVTWDTPESVKIFLKKETLRFLYTYTSILFPNWVFQLCNWVLIIRRPIFFSPGFGRFGLCCTHSASMQMYCKRFVCVAQTLYTVNLFLQDGTKYSADVSYTVVCSVQYVVRSVQCLVWSVHCALCSVQGAQCATVWDLAGIHEKSVGPGLMGCGPPLVATATATLPT